ncbi:hypothetical protein [Longispora urticae]
MTLLALLTAVRDGTTVRTGTGTGGAPAPRSRLDVLKAALRDYLPHGRRGLADAPLTNPALHVLRPRPCPPRPRASWHTVTGPDGRPRLESTWHLD